MPYATTSRDLVYLSEDGHPYVCRYRLVVQDEPPLVVVQIDARPAAHAALLDAHNARDSVINRILEHELARIPLSVVRLVLSDGDTHWQFGLELDVEDYVRRGNRYTLNTARGRGDRVVDQIAIDSKHVIIGRIRVGTAHAEKMPVTADVAALLG